MLLSWLPVLLSGLPVLLRWMTILLLLLPVRRCAAILLLLLLLLAVLPLLLLRVRLVEALHELRRVKGASWLRHLRQNQRRHDTHLFSG